MILSINHIQRVAEKDLVLKLRDFYCDVVGLREGFRPAFERFGFWLYMVIKMFCILLLLKMEMAVLLKNHLSIMWLLRLVITKAS